MGCYFFTGIFFQARPNMVYGGMNTMTPLPNNPTPPLTPAAGGGMVAPPGYGSALVGMGGANGAPSGMMDVKPAINGQGMSLIFLWKMSH